MSAYCIFTVFIISARRRVRRSRWHATLVSPTYGAALGLPEVEARTCCRAPAAHSFTAVFIVRAVSVPDVACHVVCIVSARSVSAQLGCDQEARLVIEGDLRRFRPRRAKAFVRQQCWSEKRSARKLRDDVTPSSRPPRRTGSILHLMQVQPF